MTNNATHQQFIAGAAAFKNAMDAAKGFRDTAIATANRGAEKRAQDSDDSGSDERYSEDEDEKDRKVPDN
jgi:hypothetical protein